MTERTFPICGGAHGGFSGNVYGHGHHELYKEIVETYQTGKLFSVSRSDAFSTIQLLNAFYVSSESCAWANVVTAGDSVRLGCANEELANLYRTPIAASVTK